MIKIEIWSDVMCPFCYIGKRKIEHALQQFEHANSVSIEWKSYQLQPDLVSDPNKNSIQHLSETKGWSIEETKHITANVIQMAAEVGLNYDFEHAVVANSFDAHRLSHYAKQHGKGNEFEEVLFSAYFVEGKNTADYEVLSKLAQQVGLNKAEALTVLSGNQYADDVRNDIYEAHQIGVRGVPYFVLNDKYAISGAQPTEVFLQALRQVWAETRNG
jgi:predicted DsbA family dithiol-disulfide isomerase